jgi:hypothetical protein
MLTNTSTSGLFSALHNWHRWLVRVASRQNWYGLLQLACPWPSPRPCPYAWRQAASSFELAHHKKWLHQDAFGVPQDVPFPHCPSTGHNLLSPIERTSAWSPSHAAPTTASLLPAKSPNNESQKGIRYSPGVLRYTPARHLTEGLPLAHNLGVIGAVL